MATDATTTGIVGSNISQGMITLAPQAAAVACW